MQPDVRRFIRASLLWLVLGVSLGVAMAASPRALLYRPAHMHANLLGFVAMMIFGVAYHVVPRFAGTPLHSDRLAATHLVVANVGLASMVAGYLMRAHALPPGPVLLLAGAVIAASGALLFAYNVWRTLDAATAAAPAVAQLRRTNPR